MMLPDISGMNKISRKEKELTEEIDLSKKDDPTVKEINKHILNSYLKPNSDTGYQLTKAEKINNDKVTSLFYLRRAELLRRLPAKHLVDKYVFYVVPNDHEKESLIEDIKNNGCPCKKIKTNHLGDSSNGVYVVKHIDVLLQYLNSSIPYKTLQCFIFRIIVNRIKTGEFKNPERGTPDLEYNCHMRFDIPKDGQSPYDKYLNSMMYIYEFGETFDMLERPRGIIPYALLTFERTHFLDQKLSRKFDRPPRPVRGYIRRDFQQAQNAVRSMSITDNQNVEVQPLMDMNRPHITPHMPPQERQPAASVPFNKPMAPQQRLPASSVTVNKPQQQPQTSVQFNKPSVPQQQPPVPFNKPVATQQQPSVALNKPSIPQQRTTSSVPFINPIYETPEPVGKPSQTGTQRTSISEPTQTRPSSSMPLGINPNDPRRERFLIIENKAAESSKTPEENVPERRTSTQKAFQEQPQSNSSIVITRISSTTQQSKTDEFENPPSTSTQELDYIPLSSTEYTQDDDVKTDREESDDEEEIDFLDTDSRLYALSTWQELIGFISDQFNDLHDKYSKNIPRWRLYYEKTGSCDIKFRSAKKFQVRVEDARKKYKFSDEEKTKADLTNPTNKMILTYESKRIKPRTYVASEEEIKKLGSPLEQEIKRSEETNYNNYNNTYALKAQNFENFMDYMNQSEDSFQIENYPTNTDEQRYRQYNELEELEIRYKDKLKHPF